jgi:hypothetical protein
VTVDAEGIRRGRNSKTRDVGWYPLARGTTFARDPQTSALSTLDLGISRWALAHGFRGENRTLARAG